MKCLNLSKLVIPLNCPVSIPVHRIWDDSNPMEECKSFKNEYDICFNVWFRDKFLKGNDDDSMCSELLKNYTICVKNAMKNKDIDITELRQYHSEIRFKEKPSTK